MASKVELEIITPERVLLREEVEMVIAPAVDGEIGILPEHFPLVTSLEIGVLRIKRSEEEGFLPLSISQGVMEVLPQRITVLVATAELPEEIDIERAMEAKKRAEERLKKEEFDSARARAAMERAVARIKAARYKD